MRKILVGLVFLLPAIAHSQNKTENIIIITTDGFRWQEVFKGMDSAIANNAEYNQQDSAGIFEKYWSDNAEERRRKLLPFLWSTVVKNGQVFGNRDLGSKVDNANPFWFSYPGYSEILTGIGDSLIDSNDFPPNPRVNVLEFLNRQTRLKGKVAAFGAWKAFDRILNEERAGFPVYSSFDLVGGSRPTGNERLINSMRQDSYKPFGNGECLDVFMHYAAMEYLKIKKPRVLYLGYGETDEWAHAGRYNDYLNAAHQFDAWIKQIWDFLQKDPQYKDKTTLFITTDHGRGDIDKVQWKDHGSSVADSHELWFAVLGPNTPWRGELKTEMQLYQQQFAQTIAKLMGYTFKANHKIADEILYVFKMKK